MDTVFVKDVRLNGPAHIGGLRPGDRLLSVNSMPVAGQPYTNVVRAIQQAPTVLKLIVVPKDCDILQMVCTHKCLYNINIGIKENKKINNSSINLTK